MRTLRIFIALMFVGTVIWGCGGGSGSGSRMGTARVTFAWPEISRLIPAASNSIRVEVRQGSSVVTQRLLARPSGGGSSTVSFDNLPVGSLSIIATAYPQSDGSGTAQATASAPLVIQAGQSTTFSLTMGSTIDRLEMTVPSGNTPVGRTTQLAVTAKNQEGSVVLMSPSKLQWSSSATGIATVDNSGRVTALAQGTTNITVGDSESGKSDTKPVQVTGIPTIGFSGPTSMTISKPGDVAAGDLDRDGNSDFFLYCFNGQHSVAIVYGSGNGTFAAPVYIPIGSPAFNVVTADLDSDGNLDLLVTLTDDNELGVIRNTGGRSYAPMARYTTGRSPFGIFAADFNGDGKNDIAVSNDASNNMSVFINRGDGTFNPHVTYGAGSFPARVTGGDFDGDGKIDLAVSNYVSEDVIIYKGSGTGTFKVAQFVKTVNGLLLC